MKKILLSVILFAAVLAFSACAQSPKSPEITAGAKTAEKQVYPDGGIDWDNIEVVPFIAEFYGYNSLSDIKSNSDFIVEAEVINEFYGNSPGNSCAFADIKVTKVLQGDIKEGDVIKLGVNYYLEETPGKSPRLIIGSELTPLRNGEKWLFVIDSYEEFVTFVPDVFKGVYYTNGDTGGRFPIPGKEEFEAVKKYDEFIANNGKYLESEVKKAPNGAEYTAFNGEKEYALSKEQFDKWAAYWQTNMINILEPLDPKQYGVMNTQSFRISLYSDICKEFYK